MKAASAELIAALNGGQKFLLADLYTFTLPDASVVRIAIADTLSGTITVGGNTFDAASIIIERGDIETAIGVAPGQVELTIFAQVSHLLGGVPWLTAIRHGALDGARLKVETLWMTTPGDYSLGTTHEFEGKIGKVDEVGRSHAKLTAFDDRVALNRQLPLGRFQPGCLNKLFDAKCTLSKASFAANSSAQSGSTAVLIITTYGSLTQPAGYFNLGTLTFTSGPNSGKSVGIKSYSSGEFQLMSPLPFAPAIGNTFTAYPGCARTKAACENTNAAVGPAFNNGAHFRGHPFVPAPELAL